MQYAAGLPEQKLPHSVSSAEMLRVRSPRTEAAQVVEIVSQRFTFEAKFDSCLAWAREKMSGVGIAPSGPASFLKCCESAVGLCRSAQDIL